MSIGNRQEIALEAQKFEKSLEVEIACLEYLMKTPEEAKGITMIMMTNKEAIEKGMELIKKAGLLLLKFNSLPEDLKVSLFDRLMKYIEKFKNLLEEYGNKMGVESFPLKWVFLWQFLFLSLLNLHIDLSYAQIPNLFK